MAGFYCRVDNVPKEVLDFLGYYLVREDDEFELWQDLYGEEHIVRKSGPKYFFVEDMNDALVLRASKVHRAPEDGS
jgi:hypothetical protein